MTYWLLTTEYPPFYGGGISTYCSITAQMLQQHGHQVTVFIPSDANDLQKADIDGVRLIQFATHHTATPYLGHAANQSYAFALAVKKEIEHSGPPDYIEAQEYLGIAYYLLQFKHLKYDWAQYLKIVITAHSPAYLYLAANNVNTYSYPNYWIGEMERACLQAADLVISPTQYLKTAIEKSFSWQSKNCIVLLNPFAGVAEPSVKELTPAEGQIIFYGKLSAQKGSFKLLAYFDALWQKGFAEPLHIYGGTDIVYHPEQRTMGDLLQAKYKHWLQQGKIVLHAPLPPQNLHQLAGAKLAIVPSIIDNMPYVVLEMMALKNIVLVSAQGGQAELVVDAETGFVFDHNVEGSFERQLHSALSLTVDARVAMQQAAIKSLQQYHPEIIYAQKIKALAAVADGNNLNHFPFVQHGLALSVSSQNILSESHAMLSIVVPYFNMGTYLPQTINSIQAGTYAHKEIIIVNDGSTDENSLKVLDIYRNKRGIKIIDQNNQGLGAARNTGAAAATGIYLAFLDADDTVSNSYYQKSISVLKAYSNVHFAGCWTQYFEGSKNIWPTFNPGPPVILHLNTVNSSAPVYKRQSFLAAGLNDTAMPFAGMEDYDSVVSMIEAGYYGVVLPEVLFNYRVRKSSMIRGINKYKKTLLLQYIAQKHPKIYATFAPEIANLLRANGPAINIDNPTLDYFQYSSSPIINNILAKAVTQIKKHGWLKTYMLAVYKKIKSN